MAAFTFYNNLTYTHQLSDQVVQHPLKSTDRNHMPNNMLSESLSYLDHRDFVSLRSLTELIQYSNSLGNLSMRHIDFSWGEPRPKANSPSNYHNSENLPKQNNFTSAFVLGTKQINKQTSYFNESNLPHDIHSNHTLFLDSVYRNIFWKSVLTNRTYIDIAQHQVAEERTFCLHTETHTQP